MNFVKGKTEIENSIFSFVPSRTDIRIPLPVRWNFLRERGTAGELVLGIRPHHLFLGKNRGWPTFKGTVIAYESLGEEGILEADLSGIPLVVSTEPDLHLKTRERIVVSWDVSAAVLFTKENGQAIKMVS
jgi:ABC-type sugar transport system ATPase subunit